MAMDKKELTFEEGMQQLEETVAKLNSGNLPLDEMVKLYERGEQLSKYCLKLLDAYDARLDVIGGAQKAEDGE